MLLAHGNQDEVVPFAVMAIAETALKAAGVPVVSHVAEGLGHGIDGTGLALGLAHCRQVLGSS